MTRVLVCGGRDYRDAKRVYDVLDELLPRMSAIMSGGAPGADTLAWDWGWRRNFPCERYFPDWKTHVHRPAGIAGRLPVTSARRRHGLKAAP